MKKVSNNCILICLTCNKEYTVRPYRIKTSKYCSYHCKFSYQYKGSSWNKGKKLSEDHKQKLREAKLKNPVRYWKGKHTVTAGENHYNWKGGITPINEKIRKSMDYKAWRKAVYERDNYLCVNGGKEHGSELHADHIKPFSLFPELRFEVSNGRTLCKECHKKTPTYGYNVKYYQFENNYVQANY